MQRRTSEKKALRAAIDHRIREKYPDFDPIMSLAEVAAKKRPSKHWTADHILSARKELVQYLHPKLRSIDVQGDLESPMQVTFTMIHPDA